jgi:hypothetical protein
MGRTRCPVRPMQSWLKFASRMRPARTVYPDGSHRWSVRRLSVSSRGPVRTRADEMGSPAGHLQRGAPSRVTHFWPASEQWPDFSCFAYSLGIKNRLQQNLKLVQDTYK